VALEMKSLWDHQQRALFLATGVLATFVLPIYGLSKLSNMCVPNILNKMGQALRGSGGTLLGLLSIIDHRVVASCTAILAGISCGLFCKEQYNWARDNVMLDQCLQKKMILIAHFFSAMISLKHMLEDNPEFVKISPAASDILSFLQEKLADKRMQELFDF